MIGTAVETRGATAAKANTSAVHAAAAAAGGRAIRSIDFRRSETGAARLIVRLSDPRTPINLKQQGSQIMIDFSGTDLPKNLQRRYDTMDFATPVSGFDAARLNGDTQIVLDARGEVEPLAYQSDDEYVVEVSAAKKAGQNQAPEAKKEYKGERLTLNFQTSKRARCCSCWLMPVARTSWSATLWAAASLATAERSLGPGAGYRAAHQGPGQAAGRQRHHRCPRRRTLLARKGGSRRQEGAAGTRAAACGIPAGQLRQGLGYRQSVARHGHRRRLGRWFGWQRPERGALVARARLGRRPYNTLLLQDTADRIADVRRLWRRSTFRFARCSSKRALSWSPTTTNGISARSWD